MGEGIQGGLDGTTSSRDVDCPSCAARVAEEAFCGRCGEPLTAGVPTATAAVERRRSPGRPVLVALALLVVGVLGGGIALLVAGGDSSGADASNDNTTLARSPSDTSGDDADAVVVTPSSPVVVDPTTSSPDSTTTTTTVEPEPFRYSYPTIAELPELPTKIEGYVATGGVERSSIRVFESSDEIETADGFPTQGNRCEYGFWVARWVSGSADVRVLATNEIYLDDATFEGNEVDESLLPPTAPAGIMGGFSCTSPGFRWAAGDPDVGAGLIDVMMEWQYFELDFFETEGPPPEPVETAIPTSFECTAYVYDDELPIDVCSQGYSVELFQEALGLDADGYFGPGTQDAVAAYQTDVGLPATGVMDAATWAVLGVTSAAPYPDLNGDGVVDGSEIGFD